MRRASAVLVMQLGCWSKPELPPEPIPGPMPVLIGEAHAHSGQGNTMSFDLTIPDAENRFLVVAVAMSADSGMPAPVVTSMMYDDVLLTPTVVITGVPVNSKTRSEQWQLVAPPVGTFPLTIALGVKALTIHGCAMAFSGVNQTDPVRDSAAKSGAGVTSSVILTSAFSDLVESTIANGNGIMGPAIGQKLVYVDNVDGAYELNNSAASTAPGVEGPVEVNWGFSNSDEWQGLAASLRPLLLLGN